MRAFLARLVPGICGLAALSAIAACSIQREPLHDPVTAGTVRELAVETLALLQHIEAEPQAYAERAPQYRALQAKAETIRLFAEARSYGGGALAVPGTGLFGRVTPDLPVSGDLVAAAEPLAGDYADATLGFMTDYSRNLRMLEEADRKAGAGVDARIAAYEAEIAAYGDRTEAYLAAWRRWEAGLGPRPEPVGPAPEPVKPSINRSEIALRRAALTDILRDTLIYERDILDRSR